VKLVFRIKDLINKTLIKFGYRISKINTTDRLFKIYKYKNYDEYKDTQIFFNKQKINKVWADENTLKIVSNFLKENIKSEKIKGLCHGSRNGFEQKCFINEIPNAEVIGTDISETANDYDNSIVHDFHDEKKDWIENFDFVYSNSLDQSYDPEKALNTWINQVKKDRYVIIEHSDQHGVISSGKMDPFGVEANFFPYLLTEWFGHKISLKIIKSIKKNKNDAPVYFFIMKKTF
tara:strand:+ start:528 stop:1226 length:699 start_codon:yes stop_codon:yes gene_type:complete